MKTIGVIRMVLVTVLLSFSFIACGSDDEDSSTNPIVGTWYVYSSDLYTEMTFENDMTFTWKEYEKNYTFRYQILSEIYFTLKNNKMSLFPILFGVWL